MGIIAGVSFLGIITLMDPHTASCRRALGWDPETGDLCFGIDDVEMRPKSESRKGRTRPFEQLPADETRTILEAVAACLVKSYSGVVLKAEIHDNQLHIRPLQTEYLQGASGA